MSFILQSRKRSWIHRWRGIILLSLYWLCILRRDKLFVFFASGQSFCLVPAIIVDEYLPKLNNISTWALTKDISLLSLAVIISLALLHITWGRRPNTLFFSISFLQSSYHLNIYKVWIFPQDSEYCPIAILALTKELYWKLTFATHNNHSWQSLMRVCS